MHIEDLDPAHVALLRDGLSAPSAHNAQPWRIRALPNGHYELHYDQTNTPEDPYDKDAYLTMGALAETLSLQAPNHDLSVDIKPILTRDGSDMHVADVLIKQAGEPYERDVLSQHVNSRVTNRNKYNSTPMTQELEQALRNLGNLLIDPNTVRDIVKEASIKSWRNPRYISDLEDWFRDNNLAEDGITPGPFNINRAEVVALKFTFWKGGFKSKFMGYLFSSQDVSLFSKSPSAAVLDVEDLSPNSLFSAGRRLLRSWVTINAAKYSYQPFSVAVDDKESSAKLAKATGAKNPVSLYRIGVAKSLPKVRSNRRPLEQVIIA